MYAGQKKVAKDIDRRLKREINKDNSKKDALRKMWYYQKIKKKNGQT